MLHTLHPDSVFPRTSQALSYELAAGVSDDDLAEEDRYYLNDAYKRTVLEHMSTAQLLDMLLIHPTVCVSPSYRDTGLTASYTFKPLSNLVSVKLSSPAAVAGSLFSNPCTCRPAAGAPG